ncbi:LOW QUALITY PROTEIN: beta-microseminoprotein, partial [Panthera leo]|uniref:LOW QUALITY PROTEIN: beta-microseminoprotein n=1 Tax=Panthera leo TaxID=9689 RepID=UPI001C697B11
IGSPSHLCFTLHNVLLGSLRVLANFVTLCNAQCCVIPNKNTPGGLSNGERCPDLKLPNNWLALRNEGSDFPRSPATTVHYDKNKCQKIFNKEICSYKVVEQNDPERTCIVL